MMSEELTTGPVTAALGQLATDNLSPVHSHERGNMRKFACVALVSALAFVGTLTISTEASAKTVRLKTDWGYVSFNQVKAPKPNRCVTVKVTLDLRNVNRTPYNLAVAIQDEFGNVIGFNNLFTLDESPGASPSDRIANGKYQRPIRVCAMDHFFSYDATNPNAWRVPLAPYSRGTKYAIVACSENDGDLSQCFGSNYQFK